LKKVARRVEVAGNNLRERYDLSSCEMSLEIIQMKMTLTAGIRPLTLFGIYVTLPF
jgi:hypothetical protein